MGDHHDHPSLQTLADGADWAVIRCEHGCLHLRLGPLTLTLSPVEFERLVTMLGEAYVRLSVRNAVERCHKPIH
ncbi:MAG: hypothetical protein GEU99_19205 [Luteitalea sp.]|nr:hypothetical protein [Luteitalea sp.]